MNRTCLFISPGINCLAHPERWTTIYDFPRGLLSIATFLDANGIRAEVLPLDYYIKPIHTSVMRGQYSDKKNINKQIHSAVQDAISTLEPAFIGISVPYTMLYPAALKIAELCKKIKPDSIVVLGGPHVSYRDRECFNDSEYVDIVVRGEGEWTFLNIVKDISSGIKLECAAGITFRDSSGNVKRNPLRQQGNLVEIPMLNYRLLPEGFVKNMAVSVVASRGCAYKCTYCNESIFWGQKVRAFSVDVVFEEIKNLAETYGNYAVGLEDSMFNMKSRYFFDLLKKLSAIKLHPAFYILSRVDSINEEGFEAMEKAGIKNLILGIESASPRVLQMMNKKITIQQAEEACIKAVKHGLTVDTFWIIGHPGDNPHEAEITLAAIDRFYSSGLHQNSEIAMFVPYPGTRIFESPQEFDLEILTYEWEKWARFNSEPVYQLKEFSKEDITGYWTVANRIANEWKQYNAVKKLMRQ